MLPRKLGLNKGPSRRWRAFYWCALILVWTLYGAQLVFSYVDGYQDPYSETKLLVPVILSGVIIGYKWAYRKMSGFETDIAQLRLSPKGKSHSNDTTDWYVQEFQAIFNWRRCAATAILFTLAALLIGI